MLIRRLTPVDATVFQQLRLESLRESPEAFGSSYEEEAGQALSAIEARLNPKIDRGVFGAFVGDRLMGLVGLGRENLRKLSHKAFVWGLYVVPDGRGKGIAKALLAEACALARSLPEVRQVNLCVNASNQDAIRLYESFGFCTFGREPRAMFVEGVFHDELHMQLVL